LTIFSLNLTGLNTKPFTNLFFKLKNTTNLWTRKIKTRHKIKASMHINTLEKFERKRRHEPLKSLSEGMENLKYEQIEKG
jgi:hypothetical protein